MIKWFLSLFRRKPKVKQYPLDLSEVCRERRTDGPTPCYWPECDCDQ